MNASYEYAFLQNSFGEYYVTYLSIPSANMVNIEQEKDQKYTKNESMQMKCTNASLTNQLPWADKYSIIWSKAWIISIVDLEC